jgi:hypothetical protein
MRSASTSTCRPSCGKVKRSCFECPEQQEERYAMKKLLVVVLLVAAGSASPQPKLPPEHYLAIRDVGHAVPTDHYKVKMYASILNAIQAKLPPDTDRVKIARVGLALHARAQKELRLVTLEQTFYYMLEVLPADGRTRQLDVGRYFVTVGWSKLSLLRRNR